MPEWADERDSLLLTKKIEATGIVRADWWPDGGYHEVTFAVEVFAEGLAEYIGDRAGADAWKKQFDPRRYLTGTIDYWRPGWIDDLKTGRWPVHPSTRQLLSYALYDWLALGRPDSWECERTITQWPKYPIAKPPVRSHGPLMADLDIREHLDNLRYALTHDDKNPTEEYCRFCDSRSCCPEAI